MNLKLRLFKDEVPKLSTWSNGTWSSDWIVVFTNNGRTFTTMYTVGGYYRDDAVTEEARLNGNIDVGRSVSWKSMHEDSAWCYCDDLKNLLST